MKIEFAPYANGGVLAGAAFGTQVFSKIITTIDRNLRFPEVLFLDFGQIDTASASFLRETVFALRDILRSYKSNYYPVISNPNDNILDELRILVQLKSDVVLVCNLSSEGIASNIRQIGELDPKQAITYALVKQMGETDAIQLSRNHGMTDGTTSSTAWNNRLAALSAKGLVFEVVRGRSKKFKPLFQELSDGR